MQKLSEDYLFRFGGISRLYGLKSLEKLAESRFVIIGLGGVGSWVVEAVARSGVGQIVLVDLDDVCASNTNRQIQALTANIGKSKADVLKARILEINPFAQVEVIIDFYNEETFQNILKGQIDFLFDCIDSLDKKAHLMNECVQRKIPFITCGGVGGKKDPLKIKLADLSLTENDPLLKNLKKILRKKYGFPEAGRKMKIECVYSTESAVFPSTDENLCLTKSEQKNQQISQKQSLKLDCRSGFGAASFLSGSVGFCMVSRALDRICQAN